MLHFDIKPQDIIVKYWLDKLQLKVGDCLGM